MKSPGIRKRSGEVNSSDRLVTFLYLILRDHILPGDIEEVLRNVSDHESEFSNGWLAEYAKDIAERLRQ